MNSATVSTLQDATDEDKRDLPLSIAQEFQCLRFPPIGASQLGNNKVIGVRGQRSLNSSGVTSTSALTVKCTLLSSCRQRSTSAALL